MAEPRTEGYKRQGLYDPAFEYDACGIGAVVDIQGRKSHQTVDHALKIVEKLEHRAGKDAEGKTGDGVGMFFVPRDTLKRSQAKKMFELITAKEGMKFLGWRSVPVQPETLGHKALAKTPGIEQGFVRRPEEVAGGLDFDRKLYVARRAFEQSGGETYVVSQSSRTIVYKGMFLVGQLRQFYRDLQSPDYKSAIALVHSRFSTNTNPSWERAHPNRMLLHNGEINTIRGNIDRMLAREGDKILPVVNAAGSDSAMVENTAVVGSGPSGLAAAAQLNSRGHAQLMEAEGIRFQTGVEVGRDFAPGSCWSGLTPSSSAAARVSPGT